MNLKREPVMVAGVTSAILSLLTMLVALNVIDLSGTQLEAIGNAVEAVAPYLIPALIAIGSWVARMFVTPVADPRTAEGKPGVIIEQ